MIIPKKILFNKILPKRVFSKLGGGEGAKNSRGEGAHDFKHSIKHDFKNLAKHDFKQTKHERNCSEIFLR
jgi:hypothetical protein